MLLPINLLIFSGMCSTPKLLKYVTLLSLEQKAIQGVPIDLYSLNLLRKPHLSLCLADHFVNKHF